MKGISLAGLMLVAAAGGAAAQGPPAERPATYVFVHGAWGGAWDWKKVASLLAARGHAVARVVESAVGGMPDELLGEAVWACIVLRPDSGVTRRDVLFHCAAHLEDFKVPKQVEFWDSLPRTASGKVTKAV